MRRLFVLVPALVSLGVLGCKSGAASKPLPSPEPPPLAVAHGAVAPAAAPSADAAFSTEAERILDGHLAAHPDQAVALGLHEFDGRLPAVSSDALRAEVTRLDSAIATLQTHDPADLSDLRRAERAALLTTLRGERFKLVELDSPRRNPMFYMDALALTPYVSLQYAEPSVRADAIIAIAQASGPYLAQAKTNLAEALPRTYIDTALIQARGSAQFAREDVPRAFAGLDPAESKALAEASSAMAEALDDFATFLEARKPAATSDYALGPEVFRRMLAETQGIDIDLDRLEDVVQADLERNLAAMEAAAKRIDPKAATAKVVARVVEDKPPTADILAVASAQSDQMRAFLVQHDIVSIPSEEPVQVVESPPFMRWNAAFLGGAGPFDSSDLPSFYYISPPDPKWSKKKQRAYIPGTHDLLFITIHEVWPGHFLHGLHIRANESRILRSVWNYALGEGWAHYTEEMMWDAGLSEDPAVHIGQLQNALLRDVRALSAIGLHTKGMTVEQSKKLFLTQAFQDEANADQQAVRGTFDPMYLSYTVGKLIISKMRDDLRARAPQTFSLHDFHDAVLAHGGAPLSVVRSILVGDEELL